MDETQETLKEEPKPEDTGEGDKPRSFRAVDDANLAAKRLEEATAEAKVENDRKERLVAEAKLGGYTDAGQVKEQPKEESPEDYSRRLEKGEVDLNEA